MQLTDLMRVYAQLYARAKILDAESSAISATLKTLTQQMNDLLPPESAVAGYTFEDGVQVSFERGSTERFVPVDGQSDNFYEWLQANNRWDFMKRDFKQTSVTQHLRETGALPPFLRTMKTETTSVKVKGLTPNHS